MELELRTLDTVQWRLDDDASGTFEGIACRFNKVDSYGTTFHPGCFRKGGLDKKPYSLLFMHDPTRPIGTFRAEERDDHLFITGRYDDTAAGQDARAMARSGSAPELSVGFVRTDLPDWKKLAELSEEDFKEKMANIRGARLVETSQITARMAAVPGSKLKTVRAALGELYAEEPGTRLEEQVAAERQVRRAAQIRRRRALALLGLADAGGV
ncbi:HK97 family phage prohead protease [Streptomyces werraensis]|uniref:HK97 family phage prohead protease n=1 Tax=Streptomyces werraensis TaxID=68284 RepID=UPI0036B13549